MHFVRRNKRDVTPAHDSGYKGFVSDHAGGQVASRFCDHRLALNRLHLGLQPRCRQEDFGCRGICARVRFEASKRRRIGDGRLSMGMEPVQDTSHHFLPLVDRWVFAPRSCQPRPTLPDHRKPLGCDARFAGPIPLDVEMSQVPKAVRG